MVNTVATFLDYLEHEKHFSSKTIESYKIDLYQLSLYLEQVYEENDVLRVNHLMIKGWLAELIKKGLSSSSVNRKISALKSYYKYLIRLGYCSTNPMEKIVTPKKKKTLPSSLSNSEIQSILSFIEASEYANYNDLLRQTVVLFFIQTGVRRAELIQLKMDKVDLSNNQIKITGKGNKERIIPISNSLKNKLNIFLESRPITKFEELFLDEDGEQLKEHVVYKLVTEFIGLFSSGVKKSPHVLRHSFATHMLNAGADLNAIKELLGHANLNATQIYTQNSIENLKNIHKLSHPKSR